MSEGRHQVIVVGGGFGGIRATRALAGADADVTIVDRANHHLFQPLLYQVGPAGLRRAAALGRPGGPAARELDLAQAAAAGGAR
jgi:2-polyprenyl-6-methoxyphenol hydroxylase-like FAD-dependent oxidoreductase